MPRAFCTKTVLPILRRPVKPLTPIERRLLTKGCYHKSSLSNRRILVSIKDSVVGVLLPELLIRPLQPHPQEPGRDNSHECKSSIACHSSQVLRSIGCRVKISRIDIARIGYNVDN